jgi:hypothetical protein
MHVQSEVQLDILKNVNPQKLFGPSSKSIKQTMILNLILQESWPHLSKSSQILHESRFCANKHVC